MKRRIAVILALLLTMGLAAASPASAAGPTTPTPLTTFFNCPAGTGCIWTNVNGGGTRMIISVGSYGTDQCWNLTTSDTLWHTGSSASADYGNNYDLFVYATLGCTVRSAFDYQVVDSSSFENWGGTYFNDKSASFKIRRR